MVPSGKSFGESPELLQVGGLFKIVTISKLILPIQRFSQEIMTLNSKQTGPYTVYHWVNPDSIGVKELEDLKEGLKLGQLFVRQLKPHQKAEKS